LLPAAYLANEQSYLKMRPTLLKQFRGKWVAVAGGKVLASGDTLRPVFDEAARVEKHPYLNLVGKENLFSHPQDRAAVFRVAVLQSDVAAMRRYAAEEPDLFAKLAARKERMVGEAAKASSPEAVRTLVELGADIDEQDANGDTGLCWAVMKERLDVARVLLELGADPHRGCPLFNVACQDLNDPLAMAELLLSHNADINQPFLVEGLPPRTVLREAIAGEKADLVKFLKSRGARLPAASRRSKEKEAPADGVTGAYRADILSHFRKRYGRPEARSLNEIVPSSEYPVAIHYIPPEANRSDSGVLFTVGLSRCEMPVPRGTKAHRRGELMVELGPCWPHLETAIKDPRWAWPITWLRKIAAYPVTAETWLGTQFTVLTEHEPPRPLGPKTRFTAWLLTALQDKDSVVRCKDGTKIQIYQLFPLFTEEYLYERKHGIEALLSLLLSYDIQMYIDPNRRNVATSKSKGG
jgi:hypothetical protein